MQNIRSLIFFLALVVGGGAAIGITNIPGEWYAELIKPSFNPPNWIFGPVWTTLYVFIAVVGWRIWRQCPKGLLMKLWGVQLALNFMWSPLFFSAHRIDIALAVILPLLIIIVAFAVMAWNKDRISTILFVPYAMWVAFASLLNGSLLYLNS